MVKVLYIFSDRCYTKFNMNYSRHIYSKQLMIQVNDAY